MTPAIRTLAALFATLAALADTAQAQPLDKVTFATNWVAEAEHGGFYLPDVVREADIVIAAVGRPDMVKGDWLKPGAVVIDVGINRKADGKLTGDVDFASAMEVASFVTPVPGGVGPMTIAMLLSNTVDAAERRVAQRR